MSAPASTSFFAHSAAESPSSACGSFVNDIVVMTGSPVRFARSVAMIASPMKL